MQLKQLAASVALVAAASSSFATTVQGSSLQDILNGLYTCGTCAGTAAAPNVNTSQTDEVGKFEIEASGGSVATMVIEVAGNANTNTFGIYDVNDASNYLELFSGPAGQGYRSTLLVTVINGSYQFTATVYNQLAQPVSFAYKTFSSATFGYYLGTGIGPSFYSEAGKNANEYDHMVAFQGDGDKIQVPGGIPSEWGRSSYILAWEDLPLGSSDQDYDDMVVYVESVTPVPEPASLALLGLGLAGMAAASRRKQKQKQKQA